MAPMWIPTLTLLLLTLQGNAAPTAYPTEVVEDKVLLSQMEDMMKHMATLMQQLDGPENYVNMGNMVEEAADEEGKVDCGGVDHFGKCSVESAVCPISYRKDGYYVCEHSQWILMFCPLGTMFHDGECEGRDAVVKKERAQQLAQQNHIARQSSVKSHQSAPRPVAYMELPQNMQNMLNLYQQSQAAQARQASVTDTTFTYNPSEALVTYGPCKRGSYRPYSGDSSFYEECMRGEGGKSNYWLRRQCSPGTEAREEVGAGGLPCGFSWEENTPKETPKIEQPTPFQMPEMETIYQQQLGATPLYLQSSEFDEEYEDKTDDVIKEIKQIMSTTQEITTGHTTIKTTEMNTEPTTYSTAAPTTPSTTEKPTTISTTTAAQTTTTTETPTTITEAQADTTTKTKLTTTTVLAKTTEHTKKDDKEKKTDDDMLAELKLALGGVGNIDLDSIDLASIVSDERPASSELTNQGAGDEKQKKTDKESFQLPFVFNMEDVMLWPGGMVAQGEKSETEKDNDSDSDQSAEFILSNLPKNSELPAGFSAMF